MVGCSIEKLVLKLELTLELELKVLCTQDICLVQISWRQDEARDFVMCFLKLFCS